MDQKARRELEVTVADIMSWHPVRVLCGALAEVESRTKALIQFFDSLADRPTWPRQDPEYWTTCHEYLKSERPWRKALKGALGAVDRAAALIDGYSSRPIAHTSIAIKQSLEKLDSLVPSRALSRPYPPVEEYRREAVVDALQAVSAWRDEMVRLATSVWTAEQKAGGNDGDDLPMSAAQSGAGIEEQAAVVSQASPSKSAPGNDSAGAAAPDDISPLARAIIERRCAEATECGRREAMIASIKRAYDAAVRCGNYYSEHPRPDWNTYPRRWIEETWFPLVDALSKIAVDGFRAQDVLDLPCTPGSNDAFICDLFRTVFEARADPVAVNRAVASIQAVVERSPRRRGPTLVVSTAHGHTRALGSPAGGFCRYFEDLANTLGNLINAVARTGKLADRNRTAKSAGNSPTDPHDARSAEAPLKAGDEGGGKDAIDGGADIEHESTDETAKLTPSEGAAWRQYQGAEQSLGRCTDKQAHAHLKKNLGEEALPKLSTWSRHLRSGRKKMGEQKNKRRSRHIATPSVVSPNDLDEEDLRQLKSSLDS